MNKDFIWYHASHCFSSIFLLLDCTRVANNDKLDFTSYDRKTEQNTGRRAVDDSVSYIVYAGETLYIFTRFFLFLLPTYAIHFYTDNQILCTTANQSDHHPVGSPPFHAITTKKGLPRISQKEKHSLARIPRAGSHAIPMFNDQDSAPALYFFRRMRVSQRRSG